MASSISSKTAATFRKLMALFSKLWALISKAPRKIASIASASKKAIIIFVRGPEEEEAKRVVTKSWAAALLKCSIHLLPISATIALSWYNLHGFFIGSQLQGGTSATFQALDRLCLQITAKLIELVFTASLSVMILDAVRDKMLFGHEGLPLGLVSAQFQFGDLRYLISHEFWAGLFGFKRQRTRWLFAVLIVTCALVALFVGPSAALLLLPSYYSSWPAGGASFWVNGDLFPSTLDSSSIDCEVWMDDPTIVQTANLTAASCPWGGYPALADAFQQLMYVPGGVVSYPVGTVQQEVYLAYDGWTSYDTYYDSIRLVATTSNIVLAAFSRFLAYDLWYSALLGSPETQKGHSLANLRYRQINGTQGSVVSNIPMVRTQCYLADFWLPTDATNATNATNATILPFPVITTGIGNVTWRYFLPVELLNTTELVTQWIPIPQDASPTSFGASTTQYPSAFLVIQNAALDLYSTSAITCSIAADWVPGFNFASGFADGFTEWDSEKGQPSPETSNTFHAWEVNEDDGAGSPFSPELPMWQHVTLTPKWLNALTPSLDHSTPGYTTLASVLQSALIPDLIQQITPYVSDNFILVNFFIQLNSVVATFVADGMSRIGWEENNCVQLDNFNATWINQTEYGSTGCYFNYNSTGTDDIYRKLWKGVAKLVPCREYQGDGQAYYWAAFVEGYGLKADSTAYYLALVVLYTHALLVIMHTVHTLTRRHTSSVWSSIIDLVTLSLLSTPPDDELKNTSTGAEARKTLKTQVRVREVQNVPVGREQLQVLVAGGNFKEVKDDVEYGVQT